MIIQFLYRVFAASSGDIHAISAGEVFVEKDDELSIALGTLPSAEFASGRIEMHESLVISHIYYTISYIINNTIFSFTSISVPIINSKTR